MTNLYDGLQDDSEVLANPRTVLTVGAHPDDAEFGAGATLTRWSRQGADITILVVTDGSKGSWDKDLDACALIDQRKREQRAAADVLGVQHCIHLDHVDGELEYSMALRVEIARAIRSVRPDVVLSHDPWQRYQLHPDHRATGLATVDGVVTAREPRALMDGAPPAHRPNAILLWSADAPDHAEPVSDPDAATKLAALLCHSSQGVTTMGDPSRGSTEHEQFERRLNEWHLANGARLGIGPSEIFKKLQP